jgi:hypothetical protein
MRNFLLSARVARWIVGSLMVAVGSVQGANAQQPAKPHLFLREIRVDSLLLSSGLDSARLRKEVLEVVRASGRLAAQLSPEVLTIDVFLTGPRRDENGVPNPRGYLSIDVGRNRVALGAGRRLAWEITTTLTGTGSLRAISESALPEVLWAVRQYLNSPGGGA